MSQPSAAASSRGLTRLFADRKIATKIAIGFGLILAIMIAISGISYFEFGKVGHNFHDYAARVNNGSIVAEIDRHFLAMRRHVGDTTDQLEDSIKAAETERVALKELIAKALAGIKNPERVVKVKHLAEQFEIYSKDFDKVTPMRREQAKLVREVLDPAGQKMRIDLEGLQKGAATLAGNSNTVVLFGEAIKSLMLLRLNAEKVFARHDDVFAKNAEKAFEDLNLVLASIDKAIVNPDVRKQFDVVVADAKKFHDAFVKSLHNSHEVEKLIASEMRPAARAIAADAEFIKKTLADEEQQGEEETSRLIAWSNTLILAFAATGLALGVLLAWLIGRSISVPTRAIGTVLVELSNGNKTVDVPYADRGDEVGDAARAAHTFKENLLRIEKMEAEQKEAEQFAPPTQRKADMHKLADEFQAAVGADCRDGIVGLDRIGEPPPAR